MAQTQQGRSPSEPLTGVGRTTLNMVNTTGNTAGNMDAIMNLAGHTADILASTLTLATRSTGTGAASATLTFDQDTLDVTTLNMASPPNGRPALAQAQPS